MSRLRRLKELRRKNRIKATACGLALALVIGSAQGLGTYALFTDTENVPSDIALSTGDVDVEVSSGFNFNNLSPSETTSPHTFTITNHGTLRQHIKLNLTPSVSTTLTNEQNQALEYLKDNLQYSIDFSINEDGKNIEDVSDIRLGKELVLMENSASNQIFTLEPGKQITADIRIHIPDLVHQTLNIQDLLFKIGTIKLDLHVEARQISSNELEVIDYGFYDLEIQQNTISISEYKENIISGGSIKVAPKDKISLSITGQGKFHGLNDIILDMNKIIKHEVCKDPNTGKVIGTGVFEGTDVALTSGNNWYYLSPVNTNGINSSFGYDKISIKLYYDYDGNGVSDAYKIYELSFRNLGAEKNGCRILEAMVTLQDEGKILVEEQNEEIVELLDKIEEVESPNEEVKVQAKPEIIELQKVEEVVIPN